MSKKIIFDPLFFRPSEVPLLLGDATKAEKVLGWKAQTSVEELVKIMIDADCVALQRNIVIKKTQVVL